jgi:membrane protease YdiL (CAAX protease family)
MNIEIIKKQDFIIGTIFLTFLLLLFTVQGNIILIEIYLFGLLLLLILGGFFLYIFTPEIISKGREILSSEIRLILPPSSVSLVIVLSQLILLPNINLLTLVFNSVLIVVFVLFPTILYLISSSSTQNGLSLIDIIAGLWVWLPIEFDLLDPFLSFIKLGGVPFQTLLALFAFMYALIFVRNLDLGLTFTLSSSDLKSVNLVTLILTLIILPLGVLTHFLAPIHIIWDNFLLILSDLPLSLVEVILTFVGIFLGIALIEELFFRGFIYQLLRKKLQTDEDFLLWAYVAVFVLMGLIALTPWVDDIFELLSQVFPFLSPLKDMIGTLAKPLGDYEGAAWPLVESIPLEILYIGLALFLGFSALVIIYQSQDPLVAALVLSSILFGWAHFEDARYIFFASIAGYGYGWTYSKTNKIVPAALIHMAVDAIWSLILTY